MSFSNLLQILNLNRLNHLANGQIIAKMTMVPLMVSEVGRYRLMLLCHIWLLNKAFFNLNRFTQVGEKVNFLVNNVEVQRNSIYDLEVSDVIFSSHRH